MQSLIVETICSLFVPTITICSRKSTFLSACAIQILRLKSANLFWWFAMEIHTFLWIYIMVIVSLAIWKLLSFYVPFVQATVFCASIFRSLLRWLSPNFIVFLMVANGSSHIFFVHYYWELLLAILIVSLFLRTWRRLHFNAWKLYAANVPARKYQCLILLTSYRKLFQEVQRLSMMEQLPWCFDKVMLFPNSIWQNFCVNLIYLQV